MGIGWGNGEWEWGDGGNDAPLTHASDSQPTCVTPIPSSRRVMSKISTFRDLRVWQRGMDLMVSCYRLSRGFPRDERFGLTSQLRRAAVSVPSNIAEGNGRKHRREYVHHVSIAKGSVNEVESLLLAAERLGFVDRQAVTPLLQEAEEVSRGLLALIRALERTE